MATLFGTKIQDTYDGLLKVTDNIGITGTKKFITDGLGVNSSVKISSLDFEVANFFFIDVLSGQDPSNYKVGINTSSPTQMLHVVGNMRLTGAFYDSNNVTGTSGQILSSTASGTDWVDITAIQTLSGSGTANYLTKWTNTTVLGNSILYETSSKIGIGTTSPTEKLHVNGNLALQGQINLMVVNEIYGIIKPEFAKINYYLDDGATTTGTPTITMSGDGHSRLGIGVASPSEALHVIGDALITGDSHADAFKPAVTANAIKFKNFASTELMRITDTGLVGIANNSPSYTLDVTGTARVSGDTYFVTQANSDDSNKVATTAYVKNLIEEIPAGLIFQGTWDALNNTPTLASGTGTTGHFYIVSTDGSTNLDGITDWKVGDWAVFVEQGVTDQWEKIDNSSVLDGFGTGGTITAWAGSGTSNTLTNSPITFSGNDVSFAGDITVSGNQFFNGEFIEGDGKEMFRYTDGWLRINEDNDFGSGIYCGTGLLRTDGEFQVGGSGQYAKITSTGAATFAGDITSAGLTVDYTGNRTGDAGILVTNDNSDWGIKVDKDGTTDYGILSQTDGENAIVVRNAAGVNKIQLQGDGDATFAGDITLGDDLNFTTNGFADISNTGTGAMRFKPSSQTLALTLTGANATFAGSVGIAAAPLQSKLDILNNGDYDSHTGHALAINSNASNAYTSMYMGADDSVDAAYIQSAGRNTSFTSKKLLLNPNGGNVGIGLTNPQAPLSFAKLVGPKIDFYHNTVNSDRYGIEVQSSELRIHSGAQGNSTGGITFGKKTTSTFTEAMRITNAGSVGIGTTSPNTKLQVYGTSAVPSVSGTLQGGIFSIKGSSTVLLDMGTTGSPGYYTWMQAHDAGNGVNYKLAINPLGGNVGVGNANPQSKLHVAGGIQMANDTDTASASKVGTLKYYTSGNNSYVDMCMQTGATTYEWINIVQNNW